MKKLSNNILRLVATALLLAGNMMVGRAYAIPGANTVYLTPSSSTVQDGDTVAVSIWVNAATQASGGYDGIDGIDTTVNFTSSQLQYVSVDTSGSAFSQGLLQSAGGSSVRIARALGTGEPFLTGNVFVAKVNLKAVVSSGTSAISLSNTNTTHGSPYTNPATQNTSVTLTAAAAPTCPAGQTGTPPNCTTPPTGGGGGSTGGGSSGGGSKPPVKAGGGGSSTPPSNTGAATTPTADDPIQASIGSPVVEYTTATLTATTQVPTQAYIQFGTTKDGLTQQTAADDFATSHTLKIDPTLLSPGQTYYYSVVSKDESGNVAQTAVSSFTTKGLTVTVVVFDKNHKPLAKKELTLHSTPQTVKTDKHGVATFTTVQPGDHQAIFEAGGQKYTQSITVPNNVKEVDGAQTSDVQNFSVVYGGYEQRALPGFIWVVVLAVAVLTLLGFLGLRSRRQGIPMMGLVNTAPVTVSPTSSSTQSSNGLLNRIQGLNQATPGKTITPNNGSTSKSDSGDSDVRSGTGGR